MTYQDFKKKYPVGSSVASPEGTFKGECVSLVRMYMKEVHGFVSGPLGNAVDIATNPVFLSAYKKVASSDRKPGDLMFWGDDAGNWTGIYGHTAIYDDYNRMYNQNYANSRVVSFNDTFSPGFIGYYRFKEEKMIQHLLNENHLDILFKQFVNRKPTAIEKADHLKRGTLDYTLGKLFPARKDLGKVLAENAELKKQGDFVMVTEQLYRKK